jgi:hypothetical protein
MPRNATEYFSDNVLVVLVVLVEFEVNQAVTVGSFKLSSEDVQILFTGKLILLL